VILASPVVDASVYVYYTATGRYMLLAIPAFLIVGRWMRRHRWLDGLVTSTGFLLQAAFVTYFLLGGGLI
jgi:TRAP-type mannitol/chloroaromatic compound transport system permease large subunit